MFEQPTVSKSTSDWKRRKIRYQYKNALQKRFDQLKNNNGSAGLLTPETSENSEFETSALEKKKRRKRRLQSILGHSIDSSGDDDDEIGDSEEDNEDDPETHFFERYYKPQATYELWHKGTSKRVPIQRKRMTYNDYRKLESVASKKVSKKLNYQTKKLNMYFQAIKSGYEIYPKPELCNQKTMHLSHLNQLLHVSVLQQKWEIAYRCFALLIRFHDVDIRSLWFLGSKVLHETGNTVNNEKFLEWLTGVFSTKANFNQGTNYRLDPVFRSGSRTHSPKFVLTWLWTCLINACEEGTNVEEGSKVQILVDRIGEMVLRPPYMDDAEVWFIYALSHIVRADEFSANFRSNRDSLIGSRLDIARNQVMQHINHAKKCLQTCKDKNSFVFPEKIIYEQLYGMEKGLYGTELYQTSNGGSTRSQDENRVYHSNSDNSLESGSDSELLNTQRYEFHPVSEEVSQEDAFGDNLPVMFGYEDSDTD